MLWTAPDMQKFVAIGLGASAPQMRDFTCSMQEGKKFLSLFWGFCNSLQATPVNGFLLKYVKDVFMANYLPLGCH